MRHTRRILTGFGLLLAGTCFGQVTPGGGGAGTVMAPGAPVAATAPATLPATTRAALTLPSAESVLQGLLNSGAPGITPLTAANPASPNAAATPQAEAVAPNAPRTQRLLEGDRVIRKLGRLVKDSSGAEIIVFEADGKAMTDAPLGALPCRMLAQMEDLSDYGNKPVKFIISGNITEYRGKNYLIVDVFQQVKELNKGIGAGQHPELSGAQDK